jgi:Caspase domain
LHFQASRSVPPGCLDRIAAMSEKPSKTRKLAAAVVLLGALTAAYLWSAPHRSAQPPQPDNHTTSVEHVEPEANSSADSPIDLHVEGFDDGRVGTLISASWKVKRGMLSVGGLETHTIPPNDAVFLAVQKYYLRRRGGGSDTAHDEVIDESLRKTGKRWLDDSHLEMVVLSMPWSVRLAGKGFLTFPPGARLPFGLDVDHDRLRVVFPLYLPESQPESTLTLRPLQAGDFHLSVRHIIATAGGNVVGSEILFDRTTVLQDRSPAIIVQDKVTPVAPQETWRSGPYVLESFGDRFEVLDARSGGLLLDYFGQQARFSPTSRFLSFMDGTTLHVVDIPARQIILSMSTRYDEGVDSLAFVKGDSYVVGGGTSYGKVGVWPTLVDTQPLQSFEDLLDWPTETQSYSGEFVACHACRLHPFEVAWSMEDGCVVLIRPDGYLEEGHDGIEISGIQSFVIKSLLDPHVTIAPQEGDKMGAALFSRANFPPDMGVTFGVVTGKFTGDDGTEEAINNILARHLTRMDKVSSVGPTPMDGLVGRAVLRDFEVTSGEALDQAASVDREVYALGQFGLVVDPVYPPTDIRVADASEMHTDHSQKVADDDASLDSLVPGVSKTLSEAPKFYRGRDDTADFGYGMLQSHWLWKDDSRTFLVATQSYNTAGSSGVSVGRICLFRLVLATARSDTRCSLADWDQDYDPTLNLGGKVFGEIERGVYSVGVDPRPMKVSRVSEDSFALVAPTDHVIALMGGEQLATIATFTDIPGAQALQSVQLAANGRLLLQLNNDGRFYLYSVAEQRKVLSGVWVDGEVVLYTDDGFYDGTPEGAHYVYRYFAGLGEHHAFSQFASRFQRPELIQAILRGESPAHPSAEIVAPPSVEFTLIPGSQPGHFVNHLRVRSDADLQTLRLFVDGSPLEEVTLSGRAMELDRPVEIAAGVHWVTAVAYNTLGFSSIPKSATASGAASVRSKGKLFYIGVAVDHYPSFPEKNLRYARRDMDLIADTITAQSGLQYATADVQKLGDEEASGPRILAALESAVARATASDTLLVSFAGHGQRTGRQFYFLTSETSTDVAHTALPWDKVAEVLSRSKARVIVLLDACHAGVASAEEIVPNDAYAAALMRSGKAGMMVLAASKGREFSQERDDLLGGHGLFTFAVAQALGPDRKVADHNHNGVIELSELYEYVKRAVSQMSAGQDPNLLQTPWLSRDEIIGEAPFM